MLNSLAHYIKVIKQEFILFPQLLKYLFSSKKRAIYVGCTGMGNLGDEAILTALENYIADKIVLYEIPYKNPKAGHIARKWFVKNPDLIILGGGTIIKKGKKESYLKIINQQIQLYPDAQLAVLGPGVADEDFAKSFGFTIDTQSWKDFLDACSFVSVRGIQSKKQLEKWNVSSEINIFHDPAIYYSKKEIIPKSKSKKIGINFAYIGNRIYGENPKLVEQFAKEIVGLLLKDNWSVFLYPTTKSDLDYMLNTIGLKEFKEISIYENYTDINKSLSFIESMDIFLGQRLHSIIFAANTFTPFHAIEYEPKTSDFLLTTGFEGYTSRTDLLDAQKVLNRINTLYESIDQEQQKIAGLMQVAKKEQEQCVQKLLSKY
ncbi:polysaccharide pyruvyl transferase family protein [Flavobacterium sp.]|uniref:polysaccharide pyruvyl transferase family protein n=1 Tax=Flavobacterium sp. TaxID=239 RepID=UPI003D6C5F55